MGRDTAPMRTLTVDQCIEEGAARPGRARWPGRGVRVAVIAAVLARSIGAWVPHAPPVESSDKRGIVDVRGEIARACDAGEGAWIYLGRLGTPFLPCPPGSAARPVPDQSSGQL